MLFKLEFLFHLLSPNSVTESLNSDLSVIRSSDKYWIFLSAKVDGSGISRYVGIRTTIAQHPSRRVNWEYIFAQ